jgi:hypothetical protein
MNKKEWQTQEDINALQALYQADLLTVDEAKEILL